MSLEEKIEALTVAIVANTAALGKAPKAKKGETESAPTPPVAEKAATAPAAAATQASAPTTQQILATAPANPQLLSQTTEMVIKLANEYSRENAIGILAKRHVTRCSDLKPEELAPVLAEATAAVAAAEAAKTAASANASLV